MKMNILLLVASLFSAGCFADGGQITAPPPRGPVTIYHSDYTTAVTTTTAADTVEVVFATATIPANTLAKNGDCIRVEYAGLTANDTNTKTVRLRWGGASGSGFHRAMLNTTQARFLLQGTVCRADAGIQLASGGDSSANPSNNNSGITHLLDETQPISLVASCQNGSSVLGDCSFGFLRVVFEPAP